jgi:hypothetical protein
MTWLAYYNEIMIFITVGVRYSSAVTFIINLLKRNDL